jgi:hypothetical protein
MPRQSRCSRAAALAALATLALALAGAVPALATVTVTIGRPLDGDILASPIDVVAAAASSAPGAQVTGWHVYIDGVSAYGTAGPTGALSTRISMDNGEHELIVVAWDSTGDYASATLTLTVGICSGFTVTMDSPAGGTEPSPVHFAANAASCHRITGFVLYADSRSIFEQAGSRSVETSVELPAGNHTVFARAWDSTGASASSSTVAIEVEAKAIAPPPSHQPPAPSAAAPPAQPPPAPPAPAQPPGQPPPS